MELIVKRKNGSEHTVLFDSDDAPLVLQHTWGVLETRQTFYAYTMVPAPEKPRIRARGCPNGRMARRTLLMHQLLLAQHYVDHINHNGLDNRRENLRPATMAQQLANQRPIRGGTSRFKGVFLERPNRWLAYITVDKHRQRIGLYSDEVSAARAYDAAALAAWGEYASLNFPKEQAQ